MEERKQNKKQEWKKTPNQTPSDANVIPHHQHKDAQIFSEQWLLWNNSLTVIVEHDDTWCDARLCGQFSHQSQQCPLPDSHPQPICGCGVGVPQNDKQKAWMLCKRCLVTAKVLSF